MMLSCLVVLRALYIRVKGRGHDDDNQQEVRTKYKNSFSNMQQLAACVEQTTTRYNRFKALFLMSTPSSAFGLFLSFLFISMCVCVCVCVQCTATKATLSPSTYKEKDGK